MKRIVLQVRTVDDGEELLATINKMLDATPQTSTGPGVSATLAPRPGRQAFPGSEVVTVFLEFGANVGAGVIATWICGYLAGRKEAMRLNGSDVILDDPEALAERIERLAEDTAEE